MKKIFAILVVISLLSVCVFSASAAITADEKKIIDALSEEITMKSGTVVALPDRYINQAEDYLTKADLTTQQVTEILGYIEEAQKAVEASEAKSLSVASDAVKQEVIKDAEAAAKVVGADLHVTKIATTGGEGTVVANYKVTLVFDSNSGVEGYTGTIELTLKSDEITKTGVEGNVTVAVVASAVVLLAAGFVVFASRKRELSK